MAEISLGPFALQSPIARGGMGVVWRGRHRGQDVPVAVKVLTTEHARQPEYVQQLREEVRAVAALDHPGIVMLLDHGVVDTAAERASEGQLVEGSPWFAMELATGGTLSRLGAPTWPVLKAILLAILDALAHAHARGVVHRDLKPSNVLISRQDDLRPGLKLTDFGVSHAYHRQGGQAGTVEQRVLGTPMYMAPEQIRGEWRDYGPWTDLYAMGGLIYRVVTGDPLFPNRSQRAMVLAHLAEEPRPLLSRHPLPRGFVGWLSRLLAKDPMERFRRAADAAWALVELGDPVGQRSAGLQRSSAWADMSQLGESWRLLLDVPPPRPSVLMETVVDAMAARRDAEPGEETPPPLIVGGGHSPPIPARWSRPLAAPPPAPLLGAGLALYGLRAISMVGRYEERDRLWKELREVQRQGTARVVLLHGPAGTGKSRLARWLVRRAHEVGAASVAQAVFSPELPPGEALRRLGAAYLRTGHLEREQVADRVRRFVLSHGGGTDESRVLTELLHPASSDQVAGGADVVRLSRPSEYYAATRDAMYRLSQERPLVAWFDDVQWGLHGIGLALQILRTQDEKPFPVLIVMTMRDEEVAERPDEQRRLAKLMQLSGVVDIPLGPLPAPMHSELVRGLLRLDGALAARVEERTAGNPLFAVQLVGDWVRRGILQMAEEGFQLVPGADPSLPDDLHQLWSRRIDELLRGFPEATRGYLEIAALLGREVLRAEWRRACDDPAGHFGDRFPGDEALRGQLVERLLEERLAVGDRRRWSFVHGMLRESLERDAVESGRAMAHHAACATMLADRDDPTVAERLGRHLVAAGRHDEAVLPLLRGVDLRLLTFGPQPAMAVLVQAEAAVEVGALSPEDRRRGQLAVRRARVQMALGEPDAARATIDKVLEHARRFSWQRVQQAALAVRADLLLSSGDLQGASTHYAELASAGGAAGARGRIGQARIARRRGDFSAAIAQLRAAVEQLDPRRDPLDLAEAELQLGRAAAACGQEALARSSFQASRERFAGVGGGGGTARCLAGLAALYLRAGELEEAERALARALSLHDVLGSGRVLSTALGLARVRLRLGRGEDALDLVESMRPRLATLPHAERVAAALAMRLFGAGLSGEVEPWTEVEQQLRAEAPAPSHTVGGLLWLAGEAAAAAGLGELAERALRPAAAHLRGVGDVAASAEVLQQLAVAKD